MLGIKKLNITAYHPECDGIVEQFNHTLKSMLRKHAARFNKQWARFLQGVLWSYRNPPPSPHESTGEKPSFLLFGVDLHSLAEAAFLPPAGQEWSVPDELRSDHLAVIRMSPCS